MLCAVAQSEGWTVDLASGLCQVRCFVCASSFLVCQSQLHQGGYVTMQQGSNIGTAESDCCTQVKQPEVPDQERAHPEHLEDLTQYLMHLERA